MVTSSRFYIPRKQIKTGKELLFLGLSKLSGVGYFVPKDMQSRRIVDRNEDIGTQYQVSYNFSSRTRANVFRKVEGGTGEYGVAGISFRLLYEFLCEHYNSGEYFIDTYFQKIFDTRPVYKDFLSMNDSIVGKIEEERAAILAGVPMKKDGTPDMRFSVSKSYKSFKAWQDPIARNEAARVSGIIKGDIVACLSTGRIPLRRSSVGSETKRKRAALLGLDPERFFFASGQLIRNLEIFVELGGREWT